MEDLSLSERLEIIYRRVEKLERYGNHCERMAFNFPRMPEKERMKWEQKSNRAFYLAEEYKTTAQHIIWGAMLDAHERGARNSFSADTMKRNR